MNKTWKALAGATVAMALVLAPLAASGAVADDSPPPEETTSVATEEVVVVSPDAAAEEPVAAEGVVEAPAEEPVVVEPEPEPVVEEAAVPYPSPNPTGSNPPVDKKVWVCKYVGTPGVNERFKEGKNPIDVSVSTLKDFPGTFPWEFPDAQGRSIAVGYSNGYDEPICPPPTPDEPIEVTAAYQYWPPTCDEAGFLSFDEVEGVIWSAVLNDDGTTTFTASADEGFVLAEPVQFTAVNDLEQLSGEDCMLSPPTVTIVPDCDSEAGNILVTATNDNDVTVPVTLYLDFNLDGTPDASEILQVVPGETILHYTFTEDVTVGIAVYFGDTPIFAGPVTANCQPDVYPVPTQFNAEPEPASCISGGTFSTTFLGEPVSDDGEGTTEYVFENVDVSVTRTDTGVFITIQAHDGYVLDGLDEEKWDVSGDGLFAERFITLDDIATVDPQTGLPCQFSVVPQPVAPTFTDVCGTTNDGYTVPGDTDEVEYVVTEDGDTVFIEAVLLDDANEFAEGAVTEWTFTFTNVACPTGTTPPPAPAGLAATGGMDMAPLGWASVVTLIAGVTMLVYRRFARQ